MKRLLVWLLIGLLLMSGCAQKRTDRVVSMKQGEAAKPSEYIPSAPVSVQAPRQTEALSDTGSASEPEPDREEQEKPAEAAETEEQIEDAPADEEQIEDASPEEEKADEEENPKDYALTCEVVEVNREFTYTVTAPDAYNVRVQRAYSWCHPSTTESRVVYVVFQFTNTSDTPISFNDLYTVKIYQRETEELLLSERVPPLWFAGGTYMIRPSETHGFSIEYNLLYPDEPIEIFIQRKDSAPMTE